MSGYGITLVVGIIGTILLSYNLYKMKNGINKALNLKSVGDSKEDPNDLAGAFVLISLVFGGFALIASIVFIIASILGIITYGV